jgi:hypothetical protein
MIKSLFLGVGLMLPAAALACPGKACTDCGSDVAHASVEAATATKDPAACAKKADLVGSNCSYSTGMMAQRVLAEGATYTFAGSLRGSTNQLASHVASPYVVGAADAPIHVIANEVVESLTSDGLDSSRLSIEGKLLEVDGIKYLVVTEYTAAAA